MHFFRLALRIAIIVQSAIAKNLMMALMGLIFTAIPMFNRSYYSKGRCAVQLK